MDAQKQGFSETTTNLKNNIILKLLKLFALYQNLIP
jgi:hypothetical protein